MIGQIILPLLNGFTNAFLLTRLVQYFLKFTKLSGRKRAYITFALISSIDLLGLVVFYGSFRNGLHVLLFYYMPFLIMWLMKDTMEASRKEKEAAEAEAEDKDKAKDSEISEQSKPVE